MKEISCSSFLSIRKNQLQRQIVEAFELNDKEKLLILEFKWAHRYGLATMPLIFKSEKHIESGISEKVSLDVVGNHSDYDGLDSPSNISFSSGGNSPPIIAMSI